MRGLVVSWTSLVASATAAVSGIAKPAMTSAMIFDFLRSVPAVDPASDVHAGDEAAYGAAFIQPENT
jgi:hypothetical protein